MILIDGKKAAAELREELKKEVLQLKSKYNTVPGLTVILIGELAPSKIYVKNKEKSAIEVGLKSEVIRYPETVDEKTVLNKTKGYNETRGKKTEMKGKELEESIKDAIIFPELKVNPDEIKLSGIVSLNGEDAYEIIWSNNKKVYYATSDYHKIQEVQSSEMQGKLINIIKEYSDYQSVEGILFPQKITQNMGSQKINFKVTSISLNEKLSDDEFE